MKNGFTLIELLAVIVILAIIAVIATPIVLDIIKDAKKSITERSVGNYIKALENKFVVEDQQIIDDGCYDIGAFDVDMNGEIPDTGVVCLSNSKIESYSIEQNGYNVTLVDGIKNFNNNTGISKNMYQFKMDYFENPKYIIGSTYSFRNFNTLSFYIDKEKLSEYSNIKLVVENIDRESISTSSMQIINKFKKVGKYYVMSYDNFRLNEFTNKAIFTLKGTKNGIEEELESFNYNISKNIQNIINSSNDYDKELIISLINFVTSIQININYNMNQLSYDILNEKDRNISNLSAEAEDLKKNLVVLDSSILNNNNQYFIDNNLFYLKSYAWIFDNSFYLHIFYKNQSDSTIIPGSDMNKYGLLVFSKKSMIVLCRME